MAFFTSLDISASALSAQRFRMDVVAENVANAQTTRTEEGGPYTRRRVVLQEREPSAFQGYLNRYLAQDDVAQADHHFVTPHNHPDADAAQGPGRGVRVTQVLEDNAPYKLVYDPEHPDAQEDGYVRMPNVDTVTEMIDMMGAYRSYEANVTVLNASKGMASKALEIGR